MGYPKLLFDNRFADATPVADSTAAGNYAAANVADARPYTWWKAASGGFHSLTVDCGSAKAADFALFYGHDLFTQGGSVEIHGSTDNFSTSDVTVVASYTPASNDPFLLEFASVNYRYWRAKISTPSYAASLAIVMIGAAFVMPKFLTSGFDPIGRTVIGQTNNNENGQPLGKIIDFEQRKQTAQFGNVTYSWLRSTWQPAWNSNLRSSPFILAWDSVNYPAELALLTMGDAYAAPHKPGGLCDLSFDVSGVAS